MVLAHISDYGFLVITQGIGPTGRFSDGSSAVFVYKFVWNVDDLKSLVGNACILLFEELSILLKKICVN